MKIHFDSNNFYLELVAHKVMIDQSNRGPSTFAVRLAEAIQQTEHEVVERGEDADVSLVFIEPSGRQLAKKIVQRLDGIWFRPQDFHTKNVGIRNLYNSADAVIWQSDFDRKMTTKWWGIPAKSTLNSVIRNGIDTTRVEKLTIPSLIELRNTYDKVYVCSSNWHAQKRLKANIDLYFKLRQQNHNSCLIVMGANPDHVVADAHVFYAGSQPADVYMQVYAAANWMLHLAWADHCPNVVIEALSQGTPVICSEVGGTKELIGSYGMVLKDDPYEFELADYDNPPAVDLSQITDLPDRQQLDYTSIVNIDIKHVVERYVDVLKSVTEVY